MRFTICIVVTLISFVSCLSRKEFSSSSGKRIIEAAAKKETMKIIDKIPPGNEANFGFSSREEFDNIKTTEPFHFFTIEKNQLVQDPSFFVPIIVDNEYRAIARLENSGDSYQLIDFGSTNLAKEIQALIIKNKSYKFIGVLRIHHLYSDYLIISKNRNNFFIPLLSAQKSLKHFGFNETKSTYLLEEVINHINAAK